jgi:hypothetical protein
MRSIKREGDDRRMPMSMRIAPAVRDRLVAAAQASGRSLTQEIELRLDKSFDREDLLASVLSAAFGREVGGIIFGLAHVVSRQGRVAMQLSGASPERVDAWPDDPTAYAQVIAVAKEFLTALRPPGKPKPKDGYAAALASSSKMTLAAIKDPAWGEGFPPEQRSRSFEAVAAEARALLGPLVDRLKGETK